METTFEKARENAVILREFHERVGKHDRGKGEGRMEKGITVS